MQVTHLVLSRPPDFKFQAGDYIFIKIPLLAKYEYHPFTISSAPELEGEIAMTYMYVRRQIRNVCTMP